METKEILLALRTKHGLSQDALAERVFVTRQAVSRWETGLSLNYGYFYNNPNLRLQNTSLKTISE